MDPIADMISQIKNAARARKATVVTPFSTFRRAVAETLVRAGYLSSVEQQTRDGRSVLDLGIVYGENGQPAVREAVRVSKLSRRVYKGSGDIRPVRRGHGDVVVSTPRGVLTGAEARKHNVGGEILFEIW